MAPELRKRKSVSDTKTNGAAKVEKTPVKSKRKAAEDVSPVSLKKQKSVKKAAPASKPAEKPAQKKQKKTTKPVEEEPVEDDEVIDVPDVSSGEEEEEEDDNEVKALVAKLDSDDEDMTEGDELFKEGQDVGKVPKVSKKVQAEASGAKGETGVIYIGRIPHGFYEHEMRQYFEQFGPINKLRVSRNKKTGASKHYAFVEFAEASTADIVSKTMDNYLLFGHILKCRVIAKDQVHKEMFKGANRRFKQVPWNKMAGQKLAKAHTESDWANKVSREKNKRAKKAAKLKEIGYDFEAPEIKDIPAPAPIEPKEEVKAIEAAPAEKEVEAEKPEEAVEEVKEAEVVEEKETKAAAKAKASPKAKAPNAKATRAGKGRKSRA